MLQVKRMVAPARTAAAALPWVTELADLYEDGCIFREGQLIMVAGQPGCGKSLFVQWLTARWRKPTLYVSMDMSATDVITRLGSMLTSYTVDQVKRYFETGGAECDEIEEALAEAPISASTEDGPTLEDIERDVSAFVELHDEWPAVIVIDNLVDIDYGDQLGGDYEAWNKALLWFKGFCRTTGTTVIVIHHAREEEKTDYPRPRAAFAGRPGRTPELMLSVAMDESETRFRIAVVKNRTGKNDAQARRGIELGVTPMASRFQKLGRYIAPVKAKRGEAA